MRIKCALGLGVFLRSRPPWGFTSGDVLVKIMEKIRAHFVHTGSVLHYFAEECLYHILPKTGTRHASKVGPDFLRF